MELTMIVVCYEANGTSKKMQAVNLERKEKHIQTLHVADWHTALLDFVVRSSSSAGHQSVAKH